MHINTLDVTSITPHRCTFEDPSWANHCSPTLDCTANLQLLKLCVNINMLCVKIYILRKTYTNKIAQNLLRFMRQSSPKKYSHENYASFAPKIWLFRGNPTLSYLKTYFITLSDFQRQFYSIKSIIK